MGNQLLISVSPWDTRVALVEQGRLAEFYLERRQSPDPTANIYKGRVVRVLPGMAAAFVDIGMERPGYLTVEEISEQPDSFFDFWLENESQGTTGTFPRSSPPTTIGDLLREGQEVIVQVSRPPLGSKGARLTTHITLPGSYLVYSPTLSHLGVSRRIEDETERDRLLKLLEGLKPKEGGLIARTASLGQREDMLTRERDTLVRLWHHIVKRGESAAGPTLIHEDLDFPRRLVRELAGIDVDRLVVDEEQAYKDILAYVAEFHPRLKSRVELHAEAEPLFTHYGLDTDWQRLLAAKVWLKSGGYLLIDTPEALTAIDVNTGRFIGRHHLEATILKTNLEAAQEIARQVRLRNIGGLIVIDFIDMRKPAHREEVYQALLEALKPDRAKTAVLPISPLGLVEMTRERLGDSLAALLTEPCDCCHAKGFRLSPLVIAHDILRQLLLEAREFSGCRFTILAHPEVAGLVASEGEEVLSRLNKEHQCGIAVTEEHFPPEKYEIVREWGI